MDDLLSERDDLIGWLDSLDRKNEDEFKRVMGTWKKLYLAIGKELGRKEKPTLNRLIVLKAQTDDFLIAIRDGLPLEREEGDVENVIIETEKDYIDKFEELGRAIDRKIEIRQSSNLEKTEDDNPYHFIFPNRQSWELFKQSSEGVRYKKATYCILYWQMKKDGFMNDITPKQYKDWLQKELKFEMGEYWKQEHRVSDDRLAKYKQACIRLNVKRAFS